MLIHTSSINNDICHNLVIIELVKTVRTLFHGYCLHFGSSYFHFFIFQMTFDQSYLLPHGVLACSNSLDLDDVRYMVKYYELCNNAHPLSSFHDPHIQKFDKLFCYQEVPLEVSLSQRLKSNFHYNQ